MPKRRGRKSAAQTPAPVSERIYGSKKNPKGSASSEKNASAIKLSSDTINVLKGKLDEFKKKHPSKKNITLNDLKAVYRRGAGAFSKTHRPTISGGAPNSRAAWAFARVNKFLRKAAGEKVKAAYVQDDDLMKYESGGNILDEYTLEKIDKVYVSIRVNYEIERDKELFYEYKIKSFDKKPLQELSAGILHGVLGVSTSSYNVSEWFVHRDALLVMPFKEFLELNKDAEQIQYSNINYMMANGMQPFYRLYNIKNDESDDAYYRLLQNIFPKVQREFQIEAQIKGGIYSVLSEILDIYYSSKLITFVGKSGIRIDSPNRFADLIVEYIKSGQIKKDYTSVYDDILRKNTIESEMLSPIIERGVLEAAKIFIEESEWVLKNKSLVVPKNSQLIFKLNSYKNMKAEFEKVISEYSLRDIYKVFYVNQKDLDKFRSIRYKIKEQKFANELKKLKASVDKKISNALVDILNEIVAEFQSNLADEVKNDEFMNPPYFKDYDGNQLGDRILEIPEVKNLVDDYTYSLVEKITEKIPHIVNIKSKMSLTSLQYEMDNIFDKMRKDVGFDKFDITDEYGTHYSKYDILFKSKTAFELINLDKYADSIKGRVGSDLYKAYDKSEIRFKLGGEVKVDADKLIYTAAFKKWFGDWEKSPKKASKIVDEKGMPLVVYHGTTHGFNEFTRDKSNIENHFGKGYYFTDSFVDAETNYLSEGADLTNRILRVADRIAETDDVDMEEAKKIASQLYKGEDERILEVYLDMKNPIDLTKMRYDAYEIMNEDEDYEIDEDSMTAKLFDAIRQAENEFPSYRPYAEDVINKVSETIGYNFDGARAYDVDAAMREALIDVELYDEEGNLANYEFIRTVYEIMGFDGIIMDADKEFGSKRVIGKKMYMDEGTKHYIAFQSNQIKLADGTNTTFDANNPDIRFEDGGVVKKETMFFWHGGDLTEYNEIIAQKSGRYEYGAGLYLTTELRVATKYAKGSRKLYLVEVENGIEISNAVIPVEKVHAFIDSYVIGSKRKEIKNRLEKYTNDGQVKANVLNNIILNEKAIQSTKTYHLREFYVQNGIDYEIVHNAYGWGETMMVLYNMKKIVSKKIVSEKDAYKMDIAKMKEGGLVAPNGKPSNLTPEQYKLVRTPEFKAWFGDWENDPENASKVVDENGEPMVVYHGSFKKFSIFNTYFDNGTWHGRGAYFTSSKKDLFKNYVTVKDDNYLEYFLSLRNPLIVGKKELSTYFEKGQREVIKNALRLFNFPKVNYAYENSWDSDRLEKIVRQEFDEDRSGKTLNYIYRDLGFDGIIFLSPNKLKGHTAPSKTIHFVCFESNQIKLADGTNSTFDASNPDIRFENGGSVGLWYRKYFGENPFSYNQETETMKYGQGIYFIDHKDSRFAGDKQIECKVNFKNPIVFEGRGVPNLKFNRARGNKSRNDYADELFKTYDAIIVKHGGSFGDELIIRDSNLVEIVNKYAHGGDVGQEIICLECAWDWNTADSEPSDMYVCHKCGFDNEPFYNNNDDIMSKLKKPMSIPELAQKYGVSEEEIMQEVEKGMKEELEHTDDEQVAKTIALHHIEERKDYYDILKSVMSTDSNQKLAEGGVVVGKRHSEMDEFGNTGETFVVESTGQTVELEGGEGVLCADSMKSDKKYDFNGKKMTAREIASTLNHTYGGVKFADGGKVCGCTYKYYHGGELPSAVVDSLKGGEAVVTVKTMESKDKYDFNGRKLTPRQILSKINQDHGGRKFEEGGIIDLSDYKLEIQNRLAKMVYFAENILMH